MSEEITCAGPACVQVADEKRKWAVSHVTLSGKPDKTKARRRSRPWEAFQDPVEGALKQVLYRVPIRGPILCNE